MKQQGSTTSRVLLAGSIIVAAAAAGYFAYRAGSETAPVSTLTASPSPPAEAPADPPAEPAEKAKTVPDKLPAITLADVSGKATPLAAFANRPLMVNFWATWCAPCRREIPLLNRIRAERRSQNAEIVGIAVDFKDDVLKFVQKTPLEYPLLIGEEDGLAAVEAFGMTMGFPFSVFVDSQNRILTVKVGELHEDEANFAFDRLLDVDSGKLTREAAQAQVSDAFRRMAAARAQQEARDH